MNVLNGCVPVLTNNSLTQTIPVLCEGGAVTVTWTITDLCETIPLTASFNVTAPVDITYTAPQDFDADACDYATQAELQTAFTSWVTAQSAAMNVLNGCVPVLTNNSLTQTIPVLCEGGAVTVTWTITDLCETIPLTASFNVTAPVDITYTAPQDFDADACDYATQAELQTAFTSWVTAQSAAMNVLNGCVPVLTNNSLTQTIPVLCEGGAVTVTWTITDLCETIPLTASFNVTAPVDITYTAPQDFDADACDYATQAELQTAFTSWVTAQSAAMNVLNGCVPVLTNNSLTQTIPVLCEGGAVTVTWTITDLCETIPLTASFNVTAPVDITYTAPQDFDADACDYATQAELQTAFTSWVTAQSAAMNVLNGCVPVLTNNSLTQTIPVLCEGGAVTVTWTITDLCETIPLTASFNVTAPVDITYTAPQDFDADACDYATQAELQTAFTSWVTAQSAAMNVLNGCVPVLTNNSLTQTIPVLCEGGAVTVTWTITDLCETIPLTASFNVTAPVDITYTAPQDFDADACDYATQAELQTAFTSWVTAQSAAMNVLNGCVPVLTNNSLTQTIPVLCEGGAVTVTWTITDLCETIPLTASFNVTAPVDITYTAPQDFDADACDYATQAELQTAFTSWVTAQSAAMNVLNGCVPVLTNNSLTQTIPVLCEGGAVTVTWTITDLCETIPLTASFNVTAPVDITYTAPQDFDADACDYATQAELQTAFTSWVTAQSAAMNVLNGCVPVLTNNSLTQTIPVLCEGGAVTVTWTITDLCETIPLTASFNVTAPVDITYTAPQDFDADACDYATQAELQTAFTSWVTAQSAAMNVLNGCVPVLTNNSLTQTIPVLCEGGAVTVTWTITDLCETIPLTASFNVTAPVDITYTAPQDFDADACDYATQAELQTAFTSWVTAQSAAMNVLNGCVPVLTNNSLTQTIPVLCEGGAVTVTWTITDLCETIPLTASFNVTAPVDITYTAPQDFDADACDYATQAELQTAFTSWVTAQSAAMNVLNGCVPVLTNNSLTQTIPVLCEGGAVTVTWTITDLCETIPLTASFNVTAPVDITYTAPQDFDADACDYATQAELQTAFTSWVTAQSAAMNVLNGCVPVLTNNSLTQTIPVLCEGGAVTVTWTITDLCETIPLTASFNVTAPVDITYTAPQDFDADACDYATQAELQTAFTSWVTAQSAAMNVLNGCVPVLTNNSLTQTIPVLCEGGAVTVTWTITDLCETIPLTASFNVTAPVDITYTAPQDFDADACDYATQAELQTAFTSWVTAQSAAMNVLNGCVPVLTNNSLTQTIPVLCEGGAVTVTWTITDLCETIPLTASFNVTAPLTLLIQLLKTLMLTLATMQHRLSSRLHSPLG